MGLGNTRDARKACKGEGLMPYINYCSDEREKIIELAKLVAEVAHVLSTEGFDWDETDARLKQISEQAQAIAASLSALKGDAASLGVPEP